MQGSSVQKANFPKSCEHISFLTTHKDKCYLYYLVISNVSDKKKMLPENGLMLKKAINMVIKSHSLCLFRQQAQELKLDEILTAIKGKPADRECWDMADQGKCLALRHHIFNMALIQMYLGISERHVAIHVVVCGTCILCELLLSPNF